VKSTSLAFFVFGWHQSGGLGVECGVKFAEGAIKKRLSSAA
jgi:hypothetical protein